MNYEEFRRQLGKASLTNKKFATLISVNEQSISNLAQKDAVPNHYAIIAFLMGELVENGVEFKSKLEKIELNKAKPRGRGFEKLKGKL